MIEPEVALSTLAYGGSAGFGLGFSFLVVKWMAQFIAGRVDKREERVDEGMTMVVDSLRQQVEALSKDCFDLREWRKQAEIELAECRIRHAASEAEVLRLKALIQASGEVRERAALIVATEKHKEKLEAGNVKRKKSAD